VKVLVTGAAGQLGSALVRRASAGGTAVIGFTSKQLDISDRSGISKTLRHEMPDVLVNAAAYTAVDRAESEPDQAYRVNAEGPGILAQAAAEAGVPLIHISTDYVFDGEKKGAYTESDLVNPLGVYGRSKLEGELAVRSRLDRHIILRTSWVFGLEGSNFPKTMLKLFSCRPQVSVVADQTGCPTFADDIANAVLCLIARLPAGELPWGTFNYAGFPACSWYDLACLVLRCAREGGLYNGVATEVVPIPAAAYPTPAARPRNSVLDCSKFVQTFPEIGLSDWESGIKLLISKIDQ